MRLALPCNITFIPTTPPSPNFGLDPVEDEANNLLQLLLPDPFELPRNVGS